MVPNATASCQLTSSRTRRPWTTLGPAEQQRRREQRRQKTKARRQRIAATRRAAKTTTPLVVAVPDKPRRITFGNKQVTARPTAIIAPRVAVLPPPGASSPPPASASPDVELVTLDDSLSEAETHVLSGLSSGGDSEAE